MALFFGEIVSGYGVQLNPHKVQLQPFLGIINCLQKFSSASAAVCEQGKTDISDS